MEKSQHFQLYKNIVRGALSQAECLTLIAHHEAGNMEAAKFWNGDKRIEIKGTRDSKLVWLAHESESEISERIKSFMPEPETLWYKDKIQLTRYDTGGHYIWHPDYVPKHNPRKYSAAVLLSDPKDFEGGEFQFQNMDFDCTLGQGDAIVFDARIWHRVTPVTKGVRMSAVFWTLDIKDKPMFEGKK